MSSENAYIPPIQRRKPKTKRRTGETPVNKGGRPKGSKNKKTVARQLLANSAMDHLARNLRGVAEVCVEQALKGEDPRWAKLVFETFGVKGVDSVKSAPLIEINIAGIDQNDARLAKPIIIDAVEFEEVEEGIG